MLRLWRPKPLNGVVPSSGGNGGRRLSQAVQIPQDLAYPLFGQADTLADRRIRQAVDQAQADDLVFRRGRQLQATARDIRQGQAVPVELLYDFVEFQCPEVRVAIRLRSVENSASAGATPGSSLVIVGRYMSHRIATASGATIWVAQSAFYDPG